SGAIDAAQLREESRRFLQAFTDSLQKASGSNAQGDEWQSARDILADLSRSRALQGFSPRETALFVMSLKRPLLSRMSEGVKDATALGQDLGLVTTLIDELALHTVAVFQKSREEVIKRQQEEMLELSTPVIALWDGILAIPLIGTLDSARTQVVMESLLTEIVRTEAMVAIIDITGVPTVDTLTAQHLLKTVAAAKLMGAQCIISGIRPQIAQTIVHLGVDLGDVLTKSTLSDALRVAMARRGYVVSRPVAAVAG
ncbi:MAG: STAS domain-containing protein, partial [Proteobacteria bacterium]